MYPEDQEPPAQPDKTLGEAPRPFSVNTPSEQPQPGGSWNPPGQVPAAQQQPEAPKKVKPNWLLIGGIIGGVLALLIILVLVIVLAGGNKDDDSKQTGITQPKEENKEENPNTADQCSSKLRRYQNADLDIRFCYPNEWGDVKVEDAKFDPSDDGTRLRLSFADKSAIHLGLVSDDWSTDSGKFPTCVSPSAQGFPDTSNFSARWVSEPATGTPVSSVRGLEVSPNELLIQEYTDSDSTKGVCLEGYKAFGGVVYRNAKATYFTEFNTKVSSPQTHIITPTELIKAADRADFVAFVKSIEKF